MDFEKIVKQLNASKIFIFTSEPGDGKSTTLRHFNSKFKEAFPLKWVQFVDLSKHSDVFCQIEVRNASSIHRRSAIINSTIGMNLNDSTILLDFLTDKLLTLNSFELEVFSDKFSSGDVIFLWDGIDDLNPKVGELMQDLIGNITTTGNYQIISIQPNSKLHDKFKVKPQKLIPFSEVDRFELLVKTIAHDFKENVTQVFEDLKGYYNESFANLTEVKNDPDLSKFVEPIAKAQKLIQRIENDNGNLSASNPLLITRISEFSVNSSNEVETFVPNSAKLYETFISKEIGLEEDENYFPLLCSITDSEQLPMQLMNAAKKMLKKSKIVSFLMKPKGCHGQNSFMNVVKQKSLRFVEFYWNFAENSLLKNDHKKFLNLSSETSWTALQNSVENENPKVFLYLRKVYEENFYENEICDAFLTVKMIDGKSLNFLNFMVEKNLYSKSPQTTSKVVEYLQKLLQASNETELSNLVNKQINTYKSNMNSSLKFGEENFEEQVTKSHKKHLKEALDAFTKASKQLKHQSKASIYKIILAMEIENFFKEWRKTLRAKHEEVLFELLNPNKKLKRGEILIFTPSIIYDRHYSAFVSASDFNDDIDIMIKLINQKQIHTVKADRSFNELITFKKANNRNLSKMKIRLDDGRIGFRLQIVAHHNGQCSKKEITLVHVMKEYLVLIQLDKPAYKPGDEMKYRIIALDYDTKPIAINFIEIKVKDEDSTIISISNELSDQIYRHIGLYEGIFNIPENANLGTWTIEAKVNNHVRLQALKKFKIETVQLPLFEVVIDAKEVLYYEENIELRFYAKYAFGKYAKGSANLTIINSKSKHLMYERFYENMETFKNETIEIKNVLGFNFMTNEPYTVEVKVEFHEKALQLIQSRTKTLKIYEEREHFIEIIHSNSLQDGTDFKFYAKVRDYKGNVLTNSGSKKIKMSCKVIRNDGSFEVKTSFVQVVKSVANFTVNGTNGVRELRISLEYLRAKAVSIVQTKGELTYALRVTADKTFIEHGYQDDIALTIESSQVLREVFALVIGRSGLLYAETFQCNGATSCSLYFNGISEFYDEMRPMAKIVVYSVDSSKEKILSGSTVIKFQGFSSNELKISVSPKSNSKNLITFDISSRPNSFVSLLAIDKKLSINYENHDSIKQEISDALLNIRMSQYLKNEEEEIEQRILITKISFDKWRQCSSEEVETLNKENTIKRHKRSKNGRFFDESKQDEEILTLNEDNHQDIREKFSETWIWKTIKVDDRGKGSVDLPVPNSSSSGYLTAFSISDHGFAIAKPHNVILSREFFVELNHPFSIKYGEVLNLEVIAFNFIPEQNAGDINVNIKVFANDEDEQQFEFIEYVKESEFCRPLPSGDVIKSVKLRVHHQAGKNLNIPIRSLVSTEMTIRIEASAENLNGNKVVWVDQIKRSLKVEVEGAPYYYLKNFEFKLNHNQAETSQSHSLHLSSKVSIKSMVVISGDLIGPSSVFNKNLIQYTNNRGPGNEAIFQYAWTLWTMLGVKNIGKLSNEDEKQAKRILKSDFQNMMNYKNNDGGFRTTRGGQSSTFLTAYFAYVFGSAMQFQIEPINKDVIKNALQFCVNYQNFDGSFNEVGYSKGLSPSEETLSRKIRFTAFVLLAFIKNRNFVEHNFASAIDKGRQFLNMQLHFDNYAAAVFANTEDDDLSHHSFQTLSRRLETDGESTHLNLEKGGESSKSTQVLISSYVAMAYIKNNQIEKATPIIRWLIRQRDPQGEFSDSFTTAVAFEAFAMMAEKTGASNTQIHFEFYGNSNEKFEYNLTDSNALKKHIIELPKGTTNITIRARGIGYGMVSSDFHVNSVENEIQKIFNIEAYSVPKAGNYAKVKSCFRRVVGNRHSDMVIIDFFMTSGYVYDAEKSNPMQQHNSIRNVEILRGGSSVVFYIDELPLNDERCIHIYVKKQYETVNDEMSSVKIYEHDRRDETFACAFYKIGTQEC